MIMLTLTPSSIRACMNALLTGEVFDEYDLRSCVVQSFARFDIEGMIPAPPATATAQEGEQTAAESKTLYNKWKRIRPYVYNIIKGNDKPRFIKIVFSCPEERMSEYPEAAALFINIVLDQNNVNITTGASMKTWSPDRSTEDKWDAFVKDFFAEAAIAV